MEYKHKAFKLITLMSLACLFISILGVCSAYYIGNDKWYVNSVQVNYSSLPDDWRISAYYSMAAWNSVGANMTLVNKTMINHVTIEIASSEFIFSDPDYLAEEFDTRGQYNSTTQTYDKVFSEIYVNPNYSWSTAPTCPANQYDVQSVITHELGHTLCIGHSNIIDTTMHDTIPKGTIWKRTLSTDDKDALKARYP